MKHWSCFREISKDPEQDDQQFLYFFLRLRSQWLSREAGEAHLHTRLQHSLTSITYPMPPYPAQSVNSIRSIQDTREYIP